MKLRVDVIVLKAIVAILAVLLVILAALAAMKRWESRQTVTAVTDALPVENEVSETDDDLFYIAGGWYKKRDDLETVLLIGVDKFEDTAVSSYYNNEQSDFLLLLVLDDTNANCTALHLNRDTMAEIKVLGVTGASVGSVTSQLALAHTYGTGGKDSCENTVDAVSNLLYGMQIDHYIAVTMDAVEILNDLAGGVTLEVMDDIVGDNTLVKGETVTLKGEHALNYVRARKGVSDGTNLSRMERQRQYLEALQTQLHISANNDAGFILSALLQVNSYMTSDCTIEQLSDISNRLNEYGIDEYKTLEGEAVQGEKYVEFYVDEQSLQQQVLELFYEPAES